MPDSGRGLPASVLWSRMSPRHGARSYTGARALPSARQSPDPIVIEVKSGENKAPVSTWIRPMLPGRDRLLAAVVVEAALRLAAEPAGFDVFHQERAGPVLRIGEALVE